MVGRAACTGIAIMQRYYKVFEFTVPTLVALMGPDQKDAELACSIPNVRI
jgi:hypothetical protein